MESLVVLSDFYRRNTFYTLTAENSAGAPSYMKSKEKGRKTFSGYAIEHKEDGKKVLFSLYVRNQRVRFRKGDLDFDVMGSEWSACTTRLGFFRHKFCLTENGISRAEAKYFEFTETTKGEMDAHFFVDITVWLSSDLLKRSFVDYINDVIAH